jgi:hypothetical protein
MDCSYLGGLKKRKRITGEGVEVSTGMTSSSFVICGVFAAKKRD